MPPFYKCKSYSKPTFSENLSKNLSLTQSAFLTAVEVLNTYLIVPDLEFTINEDLDESSVISLRMGQCSPITTSIQVTLSEDPTNVPGLEMSNWKDDEYLEETIIKNPSHVDESTKVPHPFDTKVELEL